MVILNKLNISKQLDLFKYAKINNLELKDVLELNNIGYDNLIYENSHSKKWLGRKPRLLNDFTSKKTNIPIVSFFTGCGGIDLGFEALGYKHIAAFEINELFCKTLRKNRPKWKVFGPPTYSGDVSNFDETIKILEGLICPNFDGIFVGGPPCQPFSIASNQRFSKKNKGFKRIGFEHEKNGNLFFDYINLIKYFKPTAFLIENVPGLRDLDNGEQLNLGLKQLHDIGYDIVEPKVMNAANFEVPQYRERLIVLGSRNGRIPKYPTPSDTLFGCGSVLGREQGSCNNNETRVHKLNSVLRYFKLDYGQRDKLGRVDRLDPTLPSKTVIAGGTNGGGRSHLHPEIPRTLSVRESARLQTFPDDYVFVGSTARQFTQVGNAVPPVLAAQLAESIALSVFI